jgi:hypothetical protein
MKKNSIYIVMLMAMTVGVLLSCQKSTSYIAAYQTDNGNTSYIKIVHASPYFRNAYGAADSFNVFVNDKKINSPFLSYGGTSLFPTSTASFGYVAVPAGLQQIRLSVAGVINPDSIKITNFTTVFQASKYYSVFLTDLGGFLFVDSAFAAIPGYYNIRFINAVTTDSAVTSTGTSTYDVFSYARNTTLWSKIPVGGFTIFQSLGTNIGVADTLYLTRTPASGTPSLAGRVVLAKLAVTPLSRNYTLYFKGDATLSTGAKARSLALYVNQ